MMQPVDAVSTHIFSVCASSSSFSIADCARARARVCVCVKVVGGGWVSDVLFSSIYI